MIPSADNSAEITVTVSRDAWLAACPDAASLVETAARAALAAEWRGRAEGPALLGIVLTDDPEQRMLNRTWRGEDAPTNVLSFALSDPAEPPPPGAPVLLGDVVLAFETVAREAAEQRKRLADHVSHLVVHGVLHLLGFDHESDADAALMEARETRILAGLGVPAPYADTM
ncbi:MAG: rRNA maturation RNase YbeY [Alphaproteobacteria bacterium]